MAYERGYCRCLTLADLMDEIIGLRNFVDERFQEMVTKAEFAQSVRDLKARADEAHRELTGKIADLEAAMKDADPEALAAFEELKAAVERSADVVQNAPEEPGPVDPVDPVDPAPVDPAPAPNPDEPAPPPVTAI